MPEATLLVRELETERAKLVTRLGKIDKALDQIKTTASALTTNGQAEKPKKKQKKRARRSQAEVDALKARVGLMKAQGDLSPTEIHKALMAEGLMTDSRNDYQLCVRTTAATAPPLTPMASVASVPTATP